MGARSRLGAAALGGLLLAGCYRSPALDLGPIPAGVTVESHLTYYDVTAGTLNDIRRGIREEGPRSQGRRWGAVTRWRLAWTSQTTPVGMGMCELRRVHIKVMTDIQFPRWNPTADPDSALLAWWQQYNTGLAEHERGHALLAVRYAGELVQRLESLHALCAGVHTQATTLFNERVMALNAEQERYDYATRHGATQIQAVRRLTDPD